MRLSGGLIMVMILLLPGIIYAQHDRYGSVKGVVTDSLNRLPIEAATISVFLISDSSLVNYALTNRKGEFLVKDIPLAKPCQVLISCNGMKSRVFTITVPEDRKEWVMGPIRLSKAYQELEEVMVVGQRPPLLIKKDTLEFNAGSFRTMPNAVLEDLLKQLPGVDIDKDGNITVNGKKVNKITIDGKEFFGNDPQVAIKNLPRNIIDKVQVMDNKTRQAQFNKTTTGDEDKVINLTLRKDQKQGWFGRGFGGYGSDKRYEAGASLNYFDDKKQINFIGNMSNTNRTGGSGGSFSISNAQSSLGGGGAGITESKAGGLNFSNVFNKKFTMSGSYFFNESNTTNTTRVQRQNILPDTSFLYNSLTKNNNDNGNHRVNMSFDYRPDTMTNFYMNAWYNRMDAKALTGNDAFSTTLKGDTLNTSANTLNNKTGADGFGSEIFLGRRLRKEGRGITMNLTYNNNDQHGRESNIGRSRYYKTDGSQSKDSLDQLSRTSNTDRAFGLSISYSEPIVKDLSVLLRYNYRTNSGHSNKITNRFNPATGGYDLPDTIFTNSFRNSTEIHNPDITLLYNRKDRLRSSMGMGVQWLTQQNLDIKKVNLQQRYVNIFPAASISYQFAKTGEIGFFYNGNSQQPSILQLQPVPDNSNPLYVQLGNPDLKPSFYHNFNFTVRKASSQSIWYTGLSFSAVQNQIVNDTWFDSIGRQLSRPVNVNGNYSSSFNTSISRTWKRPDWSLRVNVGLNGTYYRNMVFTNKVENVTKNYSLNARLGISSTYKELFTIMPSYSLRFSDARYSIQTAQDAQYITHTVTMDFFWNWPKRLIIENNIQYNYNSRIAPGFRKGITSWNMAVNYALFRNQQGMLRFAVYDLLKQNTSVSRSITQTFIQDTQVEVLQRYCMLSFIYNLRKFGKPKQ